MPKLEKSGNSDRDGYDADKNLQVLPVGKRTTIHLTGEEGEDLDVLADEDIVGVKTVSKSNKPRLEITLHGKKLGKTELLVLRNGLILLSPRLTVSVVADANFRQVGRAKGEVSDDLKRELQKLSLREAVIRIAEDQLHSAVCSKTDGFGAYTYSKDQEGDDWCGNFAAWCWQQAATIKAVSNPFDKRSSDGFEPLRSVQKAINWAMDSSTPGQLLRYEGTDPMTGRGTQQYCEFGWNSCYLEPADIVLERRGNRGGWAHVCMVHSTYGTMFDTIDGNQGQGHCIMIHESISVDKKLPDGSLARIFIHVLV